MKKFIVAVTIILLVPFSVILGGVTGFILDGGFHVSVRSEGVRKTPSRRSIRPWQERIESGPSVMDIVKRKYKRKLGRFKRLL
jgi:hypothetical protein